MQFLNFKSWLLNENVRLPEELYKPILDWLKQQFNLAIKRLNPEVERKFSLDMKLYLKLKPLNNKVDSYEVTVYWGETCGKGDASFDIDTFTSQNNTGGGKNYHAEICISFSNDLVKIKSLLDHELVHYFQKIMADKNMLGMVSKSKLIDKVKKKSFSQQLTKNKEFAGDYYENPIETIPQLQTFLHFLEFGYITEKYKSQFQTNSFYDHFNKNKNSQEVKNFFNSINNVENKDKTNFIIDFIKNKYTGSNSALKQAKEILDLIEATKDNKIYKYFINGIFKFFVNGNIKANMEDYLNTYNLFYEK